MHRLATILTLCLMLAGCGKQGVGDRCQIDDDCEDGLTCTTFPPKVCAIVGTMVDAPFAVDAPFVIDAPVIIDAPPAIDAAAADAP
jgi:hypothetical protein